MFSQPEPVELRAARQAVAAAQRQQPLDPVDGLQFVAYTDGSCIRNPSGPAGFAAVVQSERSLRDWEIVAHLASSTNNRAEWAGLVAAVLFVPPGAKLTAYVDSQYVLNVAQGLWKRKANLDLWQAWDGLRAAHPVQLELVWVRGHALDEGNIRADRLATSAARARDRAARRPPAALPEAARALDQLRAYTRGDWEAGFLADVVERVSRGARLSPKQQAIVDRIAARRPDGQATV